MHLQHLARLENFSLVEKLTHKMVEWNHSAAHPKLGPIIASVVGCASVAFAALADVLVHAALSIGMGVVALSVMAFRCCFRIPLDIDLASPLIHLARMLHSIFNATVLPFLCLSDPDRAYLLAQLNEKEPQKQQLPNKNEQLNALRQNEARLNESLKILKNDVNKQELEIEKLKIGIQEAKQLAERLDKEQQIKALNDEKKILEDKVKAIEANTSQAAGQTEPSEKQKTVQALNQQISAHNENILKLHQQISAAKYNAVQAKECIQRLETEVATLKTKCTQKEKRLVEIQAEAKQLKQKSPDLEVKDTMSHVPLPPSATAVLSNIPEGPLVLSQDPLCAGVQEIITKLEEEEVDTQNQQDPNWIDSVEGRHIFNDAHEELMEAIKNFDKFKEKRQIQDPIRKVDNLRFKLSLKHIRDVDMYFERRSANGLLKISRHINEMVEFCQNAEGKKADELNIDKNLTDSVIETGGNLLTNLKYTDNLSQGLKDTIEYLENYLSYIKPRLKKLANDQKIQKEKEDNALEEKQKQDALQEAEKKRLEKKELLESLTLLNGPYKEFADGPVRTVDVLSEMRGNIVNKNAAELHFLTKSKEFFPKERVGEENNKSIYNIDDLVQRLRAVSDSINNIDGFYKTFKTTEDCKFLKEIVEWINKRKYLPVRQKKA